MFFCMRIEKDLYGLIDYLNLRRGVGPVVGNLHPYLGVKGSIHGGGSFFFLCL